MERVSSLSQADLRPWRELETARRLPAQRRGSRSVATKLAPALRKTEWAKHQPFYSLNRLHLPLQTCRRDRDSFVFNSPADDPAPAEPHVLTGHDNGRIAVGLAEADDAHGIAAATQRQAAAGIGQALTNPAAYLARIDVSAAPAAFALLLTPRTLLLRRVDPRAPRVALTARAQGSNAPPRLTPLFRSASVGSMDPNHG